MRWRTRSRRGSPTRAFPHLGEGELDGLRIDVSILSHPRAAPASSEADLIAALEPDRDGLILGVGGERALFLPSVWRRVADRREFFRHLLLKAGLDPLAWPRGLAVARFRVEVLRRAVAADSSAAEIAPVRVVRQETHLPHCPSARIKLPPLGVLRQAFRR